MKCTATRRDRKNPPHPISNIIALPNKIALLQVRMDQL